MIQDSNIFCLFVETLQLRTFGSSLRTSGISCSAHPERAQRVEGSPCSARRSLGEVWERAQRVEWVALALLLLAAPVFVHAAHTYPRPLFVPDDNVKKELLAYIKQEKVSIKAALYFLTDKDVAHALVDAHKRGVQVSIVTDAEGYESESSKLPWMKQKGVNVIVYCDCDRKKRAISIMHDKFLLFGCNHDDKPLVWTGSANSTQRGYAKNQENIIVVDDRTCVGKFNEQFERVKNRALNLCAKRDTYNPGILTRTVAKLKPRYIRRAMRRG